MSTGVKSEGKAIINLGEDWMENHRTYKTCHSIEIQETEKTHLKGTSYRYRQTIKAFRVYLINQTKSLSQT